LTTKPEKPYLTLATKVTIVRILGTPIFILLMVYYMNSLKQGLDMGSLRAAAFSIFLLVALTDGLDGYLARRRHEVTELGRILDPLADKFFMLSAVILFTRPSLPALQPQFPVWFMLLLISRDMIVVGGSALLRYYQGSVQVSPRWSGKLAVCLQMICVGCAVGHLFEALFGWLVAFAGTFTVISGIQCVFDGVRQVAQPGAIPRANSKAS